ncbi:DnaD domain-containing protein [Priestia flexa]|uniref:DnaD domain-containing protein n=1 Tax=Priestia flexa TaxID=86664 RepID=UPI0010FBC317|nr:DnaD domain protein [Priestia flexa]QCS52360.1 DnaD domain protein [Priestia flexa]
MAKFRQIQVDFWSDPRVSEEMTPEDKFFYLYLLTNPNTKQIGVYTITKKQMAFDMGYSIETINSLLKRFENEHKVVKYNPETREIALLNWGKYNLNKGGKPILDCVVKELGEVKDLSLLAEVASSIKNSSILELFTNKLKELRAVDDTSYDTLDDTSTPSGQEKEEEQEEEKEKEKEKELLLHEQDIDLEEGALEKSEVGSSSRNQTQSIFDFYQQNFGMLNPFISQQIQYWTEDMGEELVLEAMSLTLKQQKTWKYAEGILKSWANRNVRSLDDVQALEAAFKNKRRFNQNASNRKEIVPDWLAQEAADQPQSSVAVLDTDFEAEKRKLEAELKELEAELKAGAGKE